ncbi:hypothetical protein M406DRAFT_353172 [Cryphonectria parasitica EP155]|uniref:Uncharacterized protein n=1 Tax=Cryphonectria parasitica (strain ATCC 38755 / EP155) TaxID=660469 RepID=A0A9P5CKW3_CRYP1|nr:uncharacterized protein M406DRAFT_353172 [Cryphonectria parasitica EP155]KAF3761582.1 hypothetical protein M406DRAFT_353172 [Cryphonectria parasitica EP155]
MSSVARAARGAAVVMRWWPSTTFSELRPAALATRKSSTSSWSADQFIDQALESQVRQQQEADSGTAKLSSSKAAQKWLLPHCTQLQATASQDREPLVDDDGDLDAIDKVDRKEQFDDPVQSLPAATQLDHNPLHKVRMDGFIKHTGTKKKLFRTVKSEAIKTPPQEETKPLIKKYVTAKGSEGGPAQDTRPRIVCFHSLPKDITKGAVLGMIARAADGKHHIPHSRVLDVRAALPGVMYVEFFNHVAAIATHRAAKSGNIVVPGGRPGAPLVTSLHLRHRVSDQSTGAGLEQFDTESRKEYLSDAYRVVTRRVSLSSGSQALPGGPEDTVWTQAPWLTTLPTSDGAEDSGREKSKSVPFDVEEWLETVSRKL